MTALGVGCVEGNGPDFLQQLLKTNLTPFPRYRYTATLVWLMLVGGYQCPHRTIDEYVKALTGFTPTDAEDWTNREPELPSHVDIKSQVFTLNFDKMSESSHFL